MEDKLSNIRTIGIPDRDHNRWNKRYLYEEEDFFRNREKKGFPRLKWQEIFIQNTKYQDTS